jgi:8-oxo-dGTP pyrophosphatase MutT (NUDIX family)
MAETGAGVIAYKSGGSTNPEVLIVRESTYLVDALVNATKNTVASLQAINDKNAELEAEFTKRIDTIKASLPEGISHNIHYNTPTQPTVHYRIPANKWGLPKGGKEKKDRGDIIKTAVREFKEEIGIILDKKKFDQNISIRDGTDIYKFFIYELTPEEIVGIESEIEKKKLTHYSEVFDVHFEPLESVLKKSLNAKSNSALLEFQRKINPAAIVPATAASSEGPRYTPSKKTGFWGPGKGLSKWQRSTRSNRKRSRKQRMF